MCRLALCRPLFTKPPMAFAVTLSNGEARQVDLLIATGRRPHVAGLGLEAAVLRWTGMARFM